MNSFKVFRGFCAAGSAVLLSALACAALLPGTAAAGPKCTIVGTPGPDVLRGTGHADVICGRGGDDTLVGGGGNDILIGGAGADRLKGGSGDDLLLGGAGRDVLAGGSGENVLHGGAGFNVCRQGVASSCGPRAKASDLPPPLPIPPERPYPEITPPCSNLCQQLPQQDETPPVFWSLSLTRAVRVDPSGGGIALRVNSWDEHGVTTTVNIASPDGSPWRSVTLSQADAFDQAGELAIPADTPPGVYRIESIEVVDSLGNAATIDHQFLAEEWDDDEFAVYEGADTTPPALEGLANTPAVTETVTGPVDVSTAGEVTDSQSGTKAMWVSVRLPNHLPPYTMTITANAKLLDGNQQDGTLAEVYELARWSYPGTYRIVEVELEDFAGNVAKWEEPELEAEGWSTSFEVTGAGDTTAPEIIGVELHPATIPASGGTVEAIVHVRDDLSGFGVWPNQGRSDVYDSFEWPPHEGWTSSTGFTELISGGPLDGTWRLLTTLDADAPAGQYTLDYVGAYDRAANGGPLNAAELEARGWNFSFTKLP